MVHHHPVSDYYINYLSWRRPEQIRRGRRGCRAKAATRQRVVGEQVGGGRRRRTEVEQRATPSRMQNVADIEETPSRAETGAGRD